ncbi:hypothetical protein VIBHAR_01051 [Vibrio campbellii ATCC BAA-1116]|jgi:hypothetical protein|uniref:Uncharacterized protein n=1 Tax=Vibrio campbellii (strain ATCC BAA-1116) TaxID=2902295 RepID=A7MU55_VIBC1|nr:hypothetical protein VIBHAR_01051 [Vibrio campbellii ATCC BAA-1116]
MHTNFPTDVKEQFKAAASIPESKQKGSGYFLLVRERRCDSSLDREENN